MPQDWKTRPISNLFKAVIRLKSENEAAAFMRDLCTIAELRAMSERWEVAQMIDQGISYREIAKKTGVSTATITRVGHWLKDGEGGYMAMLKKLKASA